MAFQNATQYNGGSAYYGLPENWSKYSTLFSTISFNNTDAKLRVVPDVANPDNTRIDFNGNVLAYLNEIPDLANWAMYPANDVVNIPEPQYLFANGQQPSIINNLHSSTITVSTLFVQTQTTENVVNVSSFNASTLSAASFYAKNAVISSLIVSTINLPNPSLSVSTITCAVNLISSLQLIGVQPEVNLDLGLGAIFNNTALYAAGGIGLTIGGTAVVTGLAGAILNRQTDYLPTGDVQMVNTTTQLQVSTLGTGQVSFFRDINPISGAEEFVRNDTAGGDLCVRSVSDPIMNISSNGAGGTVSTFYQSFGQWVTIPRPAYAWNGNATTDLNMNYSTIVSTANVVFQPAVLGVTPSGIRSAPNAPSSKYNMLEAFVNIPNSTYNSGMRVCELALSNRFSNTASNYDYDLSLTSTGQPPTGPPTPGINYRRVLATAYNGGNPASTFTVAYQSDSPAQIIYISSNGDDTYATGTFANPFKSFDLAQTYLNTNNVPDSSPIIFVFAPGQQTFTFTVTRNNTYITTYYPNPSGFDINQPLLSQVITWQVIPFTTGATRIAGGMFGVNCWNLNVITQQNLPTLFDFENCTVINQNAGTAFIITNTTSPVTTINMTNCYLASQTGNGIISTANNFSNLSLNLLNCYGTTPGASRLISVGCNLVIRNSVFTNTSASTSNQPIVSMFNSGATPVTNSCEIANSQLVYTSNAADSVSGAKCCIQFQNSVAMSYRVVNNLFICEGATTTNGTAGQFLCVQKTNGTGLVTFNYGNVQAGATANHFPNNGAVWAKTAYVLAA